MSEHPERLPAAPRTLSEPSRKLWRTFVAGYLMKPHHLEVLRAALEARDRMHEAQEAIRRDGPYTEGRYGLKSHPGIAVERDARMAMLRALRELGLDLADKDQPRPPSPYRR